MKLYLSGPITGVSWKGASDWREYVKNKLNKYGIAALSPLRGESHLNGQDKISSSYKGHPLSTQKGITTKDRFDCVRSDLIIVNLLGADRVSIGTVMEIAWADLSRTPIILVMEKEGNVHDYPMINECAGFIVETLDEAVDIAVSLLVE